MEIMPIHLTNVHEHAHAFHNKVPLGPLDTLDTLTTLRRANCARVTLTEARHETISPRVKALAISGVHATFMSPSSISSTKRIRMYRFQTLIYLLFINSNDSIHPSAGLKSVFRGLCATHGRWQISKHVESSPRRNPLLESESQSVLNVTVGMKFSAARPRW